MSHARPLPDLNPASVRNASARPAARKVRRHSCSEASLSSKLSLPAGGDSFVARAPSRCPVSQHRGRLAVARPSTSNGLITQERPPLPRPASTGSVGLERRGNRDTGGTAVSSRRNSFSSLAGSGVLSRRGSVSSVASSGFSNASVCSTSSTRSKVEHSFKPSLFVAASDQSRDSRPGGDAIGRHPRRPPLKSFQGSLGESWGQFAWHRPLSGSRASTRASSRCSQSSLSTVGLEVLQSSTPASRSDDQLQSEDAKNTASHTPSCPSSPAHSPEIVISPRALADQKAAARWSDMEVPLPNGALFEAISLSTSGYEAQPLAVLGRPDFADLNVTDYDECTALHQAARMGLVSVCSFLLDCANFEGANARDKVGRTALHCAAAAGHAEVCSLLLENPYFLDPDAKNIAGCTALHSAACSGSVAASGILLEHPAFSASDVQDCDGETALHWAAWNGHAAVCHLLLEHPRFEAVNACDRRGRTPLHSAAIHGRTEACCAIWKHPGFQGADLRAHDGSTAWEAALKAGQSATHSVLLKLIN